MTDSEIIEALAQRVMGWRRGTIEEICFHSGDRRIVPCWVDDETTAQHIDWNPLANLTDALGLVTSPKLAGYEFGLRRHAGCRLVEVWFGMRDSEAPDLSAVPRAICLAALRALDAEQPKPTPRHREPKEPMDTLGYY